MNHTKLVSLSGVLLCATALPNALAQRQNHRPGGRDGASAHRTAASIPSRPGRIAEHRRHDRGHRGDHGRRHHDGSRFNVYFGGSYGYPYYGYGYPYGYGYGYGSGYGYGYRPYGYGYSSPYYGASNEKVYEGRSAGRNGSVVVRVQQRLARAGYYRGAIDGVMGSGTRRAIRAYERAKGLRVDGEIDGQLLATMGVA